MINSMFLSILVIRALCQVERARRVFRAEKEKSWWDCRGPVILLQSTRHLLRILALTTRSPAHGGYTIQSDVVAAVLGSCGPPSAADPSDGTGWSHPADMGYRVHCGRPSLQAVQHCDARCVTTTVLSSRLWVDLCTLEAAHTASGLLRREMGGNRIRGSIL